MPALNGTFVKNKIQLIAGTVLTLTNLVLTWFREDIPSSTPGMDILSYSLTTPIGQRPPLLFLHRMALHSRLCFPEQVSLLSVNATRRPDPIPGVQDVTFDMPQPGCRNDSSAPWLSRCYPVRRKYNDLAAYGAQYGPTGAYERTGYLVHALSIDLLCADVMTEECIARHTALGCYYSVFPRSKAVVTSSASSSGSDSSIASNGQQKLTVILVAVLCSVFGVALTVSAAVVTLLVVNGLRRRRLHLSREEESCADDEKTRRWFYVLQLMGCTRCSPPQVRGSTGCAAALQQQTSSEAELGEQGQHSQQRQDLARIPDWGPTSQPLQPRPAAPTGGLSGEPITLGTSPRSDVHILPSDPSLLADNEVHLLPNATRGIGSFGRVVEGVYQGQRVAVKLVAEVYSQCTGGPSESLLRSFAQEVQVLCRCRHPNVVRLLAACLTPPRVCLVMELMETSLERLMYPRVHPQQQQGPAGQHLLPLTTLLHVALQISQGLEYLHPTIIHRDLKPANVLVNDPGNIRPVVKITDFGLSRLRSTEAPTITPDAGTPAYLAPEGLDPLNFVITHKADIYSLAIMMWEMAAGQRPWKGWNLMEMAVQVTLQGCRPSLDQLPPDRCPPKLRSLIVNCWDADPRRRPAAAEVTKMLALIQQEVVCGGGSTAAGAAANVAACNSTATMATAAVAAPAACNVLGGNNESAAGGHGGIRGGNAAGGGPVVARILQYQQPVVSVVSSRAESCSFGLSNPYHKFSHTNGDDGSGSYRIAPGGTASSGRSASSRHRRSKQQPMASKLPKPSGAESPRGFNPHLGPTAVALKEVLRSRKSRLLLLKSARAGVKAVVLAELLQRPAAAGHRSRGAGLQPLTSEAVSGPRAEMMSFLNSSTLEECLVGGATASSFVAVGESIGCKPLAGLTADRSMRC